jgi:hypothetical protein
MPSTVGCPRPFVEAQVSRGQAIFRLRDFLETLEEPSFKHGRTAGEVALGLKYFFESRQLANTIGEMEQVRILPVRVPGISPQRHSAYFRLKLSFLLNDTFLRPPHPSATQRIGSRLISRVNCGGRNLTLVKAPAPEILAFLAGKVVLLKRPYLHYCKRAA